jgi:hypothetical protein
VISGSVHPSLVRFSRRRLSDCVRTSLDPRAMSPTIQKRTQAFVIPVAGHARLRGSSLLPDYGGAMPS